MRQAASGDSQYIIIGKIGSTYGVKGWVKIHSFTQKHDDILKYQPWYWFNNNAWHPVTVENGKQHGKGIIIKLVGLNNPEEAGLYTGKLIATVRTKLPKLKHNEYYWSDLEGLQVIDQQGSHLGKVAYLMATGTNDVLVVKGEQEHAIPYLLGNVITSIDLAKQEIHVNWEVL